MKSCIALILLLEILLSCNKSSSSGNGSQGSQGSQDAEKSVALTESDAGKSNESANADLEKEASIVMQSLNGMTGDYCEQYCILGSLSNCGLNESHLRQCVAGLCRYVQYGASQVREMVISMLQNVKPYEGKASFMLATLQKRCY